MADKYLVDLTEEEQGYLLDVIHKGKTAARRWHVPMSCCVQRRVSMRTSQKPSI